MPLNHYILNIVKNFAHYRILQIEYLILIRLYAVVLIILMFNYVNVIKYQNV
jgi:hypothetical protein